VQHRLPTDTEIFWGLRTIRVEQASARTNGSRAIRLEQTLTTPWIGLSQSLAGWGWQGAQAYVSWGEGVEVEAVPNRPSQYVNAGSVLPAAKSQQAEWGLKWQLTPRLLATLAAFEIRKPSAEDRAVGTRFERMGLAALARHRGLEGSLAGRLTPELSAQFSAAWLDAEYVRSLDPARIGTRPTTVPRQKFAAFFEWRPALLSGWSLDTLITHESGKAIEPRDRARLPALTLIDLGLSREFKFAGQTVKARLAAHNLTDRVAWREVPTTYWGGVYLFPTQPRSLRLTLSADW
jgi:Outer membrane receptor proteins, mostly Fe transport